MVDGVTDRDDELEALREELTEARRTIDALRAEREGERARADARIQAAVADTDRARRRLATTLDALPVGVWIMDREFRVLHMNAMVPTMFGLPADASIARVMSSFKARWESTGERVRDEEWPLARTLFTGETILAQAVELELPDGGDGTC